MPKLIDLTNQTFHDLTVIRKSRKDEHPTPAWLCRCTCGNEKHIPGYSLRHGHYKSCGCKHFLKRDQGVQQHIRKDRIDGTRKTALQAKLHKGNKSGHKGVMWMESRNKWMAYIGIKGKSITLGYYANLDDAVAARKAAEEKYHKPYLEGAQE